MPNHGLASMFGRVGCVILVALRCNRRRLATVVSSLGVLLCFAARAADLRGIVDTRFLFPSASLFWLFSHLFRLCMSLTPEYRSVYISLALLLSPPPPYLHLLVLHVSLCPVPLWSLECLSLSGVDMVRWSASSPRSTRTTSTSAALPTTRPSSSPLPASIER